MNKPSECGRDEQSHAQEQAEYFQNIARLHGVNKDDNIDKFDVIRDLLRPASTHPRIVECGAGGGYYTRQLLALGFHVTAIDLSAEALAVNRDWAERNGFGARLVTQAGDFSDIVRSQEIKADQFVFIKVLHHFESLDQIRDTLSVAASSTGPGGRIAIFEPNGQNPLWKVLYSFTRDRITGKPKWYYEKNLRLIRRNKIEPLLPAGGTSYFQYHYLIPAFLLKRLPILDSLNSAAERILSRTPLIRYASNISCIIDVPCVLP